MKTDNEKIAEFMGLKISHKYGLEVEMPPDNPSQQGYLTTPKYDTSWDCLMPVVQKIRSVGNTTGDFNTHLKLWGDILNSFGYIDIKKTYDASLAFITWYQSLSKP